MSGQYGASSPRDKIRDACARVLRANRGESMHVSELARLAFAELGITEGVTVKTVNTCLHDDPGRRFERVAKGTWRLSATPREIR